MEVKKEIKPMALVQPHGGKLINRTLTGEERDRALQQAASLRAITLTPREQGDLELLADGALSPLEGFLGEADYRRVVTDLRLADGTVWPIPITLAVSDSEAERIDIGQRVALLDSQQRVLGILTVAEKFRRDVSFEAKNVYGTDEDAHPGVKVLRQQGTTLLAGKVDVITANHDPQFREWRLKPAETREAFAKRGWNTVAAFQTRNPIHRAHEYLTKVALEMTDGLLIHPVVGETKSDDIPADVRLQCYRVLIDRYYNVERVLLSVLPLAMRYAGPREALLHALIRKNFGVSHFIVGRDHAGVGNYYGTYDAQRIFDRFSSEELGITPLKFEHTFFCRRTQAMASPKTTNSSPEERVILSGSKVRELLKSGQRPPVEFSRPEVADILIRWAQSASV
jgi:sulfate adenylyltransferase